MTPPSISRGRSGGRTILWEGGGSLPLCPGFPSVESGSSVPFNHRSSLDFASKDYGLRPSRGGDRMVKKELAFA